MTPELRELGDVDTGMIPELLSLFLDDAAVRLQTLSSAWAHKDFKVVQAQAHCLKGSALQMGAKHLASLCAVLEFFDRTAPERGGTMMRDIDDEFLLVRGAIEQYLIVTETGPSRHSPLRRL